jgi:hypothetical protein
MRGRIAGFGRAKIEVVIFEQPVYESLKVCGTRPSNLYASFTFRE